MKRAPSFKKFDRKYLFLEYNLKTLIPYPITIHKKTFRSFSNSSKLNNLGLYLRLIESTIQKDFMLINNFWMFVKFYSKPKLFSFFPDRRSFFCYWIFPFVGFITISQFNNGIKTPIQVEEPSHLPNNSYSQTMHSLINWDTLEYLNYKKVFLNNYFVELNQGFLNKKTNVERFNHNYYSGEKTEDLRSELLITKIDQQRLLNKKITNFETNQTQNLLALCQFYLNQTGELIYRNDLHNSLVEKDQFNNVNQTPQSVHTSLGRKETQSLALPKQTQKNLNHFAGWTLSSDFSVRKESNLNLFTFKIPNNKSQNTKFLLGSGSYLAKINDFTEFILTNTFHSTSFFKFYWYPFNLKNNHKTLELEKIKLIKLQNKLIKNSYSKKFDFPYKLLPSLVGKYEPINFQENVLKNNKQKFELVSTSSHNRNSNNIINFKVNQNNFSKLIDLELTEKNVLPIFLINSLKNKTLYEELQPLLSYNKATLLLNNIVENAELNFGLKLQSQKLNNLFFTELNINSRFLHYLKKLLLSSQILNSNNLKLETNSRVLQYIQPNFINRIFNYNAVPFSYSLIQNSFNTSQLGSYFPISEGKEQLFRAHISKSGESRKLNYYNITKAYITSILLNTVTSKITNRTMLYESLGSTEANNSISNSIANIFQIYKVQKSLLKLQQNEFHSLQSQTSAISNFKKVQTFINQSKQQIQRIVFLGNLTKKLNEHCHFIINKIESRNLFFPHQANTTPPVVDLLLLKNLDSYNFNKLGDRDSDVNFKKFNKLNYRLNDMKNWSFVNLLLTSYNSSLPGLKLVTDLQTKKSNDQLKTLKHNLILKKIIYFSNSTPEHNSLSLIPNYNLLLANQTKKENYSFVMENGELFPFNTTYIKGFLLNQRGIFPNLLKQDLKNRQTKLVNFNEFKQFNSYLPKLAKSNFVYNINKLSKETVPLNNINHKPFFYSFKFTKTKMRFFSNKLSINEQLISTLNPEKNTRDLKAEGFSTLQSNFLAKQSQNLCFASQLNTKISNIWARNKINRLNFKFSLKNNVSLSFFNDRKNRFRIRHNQPLSDGRNLHSVKKSSAQRLVNQFYNLNKLNNQSFNKLKYNLSFSNGIPSSKMLPSLSTTQPQMLESRQLNIFNSYRTGELTSFFGQDKSIIPTSRLELLESDLLKNKFIGAQKMNFNLHFNDYINNIRNRLKITLKNSQLSFIKMYAKKKLQVKKGMKQNFYLNSNSNKNNFFKINKINYHIKHHNAHLNLLLQENLRCSFNASKNVKINLTKTILTNQIEQIFRTYLSSKYNKKSKNDSLFVNSRKNLSFFKKQPTFSKLKTKNKKISLKIINNSTFEEQIVVAKKFGFKSKIDGLTFSDKETENFSLRGVGRTNRHTLNTKKLKSSSIKTPAHLIRKIGFIFFRTDSKILNPESTFTIQPDLISTSLITDERKDSLINISNKNLFKRLEKAKNLQKKRRQKKQARLTGRRKKRKRFFPRPIWLRFMLYQRFMKFRHFNNVKTNRLKLKDKYLKVNFTHSPLFNFLASQHSTNLKDSFYTEKQLQNKTIRPTIYRTNKQNWGNILFEIPTLEKMTIKKLFLTESLPIFSDIKFYNMSTNLINEFKKSMWKSYWLRTNFNNYINRINTYLNELKMSVIESNVLQNLKNFVFEILGLNFYDNSLKLLSLNCNFKNVDQSSTLNSLRANSNLIKMKQNRLNQSINIMNIRQFNQFQLPNMNKSTNLKLSFNDYGPLWYLNVRRNFSNFSNISTGYTYLVSSNLTQFNNHLYDRIQYIIKNMKINLNVDGQNQLRSFNPGRSQPLALTNDNFLTNLIKAWWIRFENSLHFSFSVVNTPQEIYLNQTKFRLLWSLNKTNIWGFKKQTDHSFTWNQSKIRDQNKSNKTNKVISNLVRTIKQFNHTKSSRRQKLLSNIFMDKLQTTNNKIKQLGLLLTDKNYIKTNKINITNFNKLQKKNFNKKIVSLSLKENVTAYFKIHPKNYLEFWWSENPINNYNLFQTDLSFINEFSFTQDGIKFSDFDKTNVNSLVLNKMNFIIMWASLILFHVSLLFTLLNISQIRTFIKFQILVLYKLTNLYLTIIYSTFKNLKQIKSNLAFYANISSALVQNITLTKKSFLLMIYNSKEIKNYPSFGSYLISKNVNNNLLIYNKAQYILLDDFKQAILKSFNLYTTLYFNLSISASQLGSYFPTREGKVTSSKFSSKEKLNFKLITENNQILNNLKFALSLKTFLTGPNKTLNNEMLSQLHLNKFDRYEAINLFMLKNQFNFISPRITKSGPAISLNLTPSNSSYFYQIEKHEDMNLVNMNQYKNKFYQVLFSNLNSRIMSDQVMNSYFNSSNLLSYNILKFILGSIKTFSLKANRINPLIGNMDSNAISNFVKSSELKTLPNQYEKIASLVLNKYIKSSLYLSILIVVSVVLKLTNQSLIAVYTIVFKLIDFLEGLMVIIYKSLEKPAELMIDFISEFFLIEWSSDILSFIPETFDIYTSDFSKKLSRNVRVLGFTSFLWQRRVLSFLNIFIDSVTKPDTDLIMRQKKGIIFWDIWAEILVQAADIYSINLSSLFNIKEEQDLFMEKLLNDKQWNWSTLMLSKMSPLMDLINHSRPNGFSNNSSLFLKSEQIWRRWSVNPYYTYQAKDTELFIESHPPKSFSHFKLMKYYPPIFEPVGNLVCQIYSGTFIKTVSKNLLLVGSRGTNKTLLIQAIAGETELKIMIDNANRYSLTARGVAIGMKLLKDVFDALALQAPCLFIIEDIHLIGERRPMLISDDENIKATENSFGVDQEEIHEKNQVIYQLSRHSIVHYKKPYKGDFSLLIPTNHFSLDFFLGFSPPKTRLISDVPQNPLPIKSLENEILYQTDSDKNNSSGKKLKLVSQIQLPKKEVFSPPSTSPFTILLLKEQKKLKPKKIVSEMPWGGLSSDQLIQLPKASYSVRVKVALLADIAIRNLSVKLDRITDLLIIIDSVRAHRGFVVIGTTHIPAILDPALRRPGRFDETLTIPSLPNLWSRWEILKASTSDFISTLDLIDLAQLFNNFNDTELSTLISKTKLFLLTKQSFLKQELPSFIWKYDSLKFSKSSVPTVTYGQQMHNLNLFKAVPNTLDSEFSRPEENIMNTFGTVLKVSTYPIIIDPSEIKFNKQNKFSQILKSELNSEKTDNMKNLTYQTPGISFNDTNFKHKTQTLKSVKTLLNSFKPSISNFKTTTNSLSIGYFQISKWFINSQLIKDQKSYTSILWSTISKNSMNTSDSMFSNEMFPSSLNHFENTSVFGIYNSKTQLKNELLQLFAGKIGEFFAFYDIKSMSQSLQVQSSIDESSINSINFVMSEINNDDKLRPYHEFWRDFQAINTWQYSTLINTYGLEQTWRRTSDLIFSMIYKRCLYNKNILIYRLFNFENMKSLRQPPSPPTATTFTPAKKYENYKRIEFDFTNRITFSVHEKIQKHQQQRYIKTLYNKPIQKYFRSQLQSYKKDSNLSNNLLTSFETSFRELNLLDISTKFESQNKSGRLSSSSLLFNSRINMRHRFYLTNQWWNTQLAEHNAETTFLSEIDWRYMFIEGIGDLWMDFPDTDQHYNPRKRQWMLTSGYWNYWYNLEKVMTHEIYYQFLMESFYKAYNFLDSSRELLDLTCYQFLTKSLLKEIDLLTYVKRFYLN